MRIEIHVHHHHHPADACVLTELRGINRRLEGLMASQAELAQSLRDVAAQQQKTINEIATLQGSVTTLNEKVAELEAVIAEGGTITPELTDAVAEVKRLAQLVDDQIPDVTAPEEPPVSP